jgi:hypothetical protein
MFAPQRKKERRTKTKQRGQANGLARTSRGIAVWPWKLVAQMRGRDLFPGIRVRPAKPHT